MDLSWARSLFTVCIFVSFMIILFIVLNKHNKQNYDDAAQSIMEDFDTPQSSDAQFDHENGAK